MRGRTLETGWGIGRLRGSCGGQMLVSILMDKLKEYGYQITYMGPDSAEIYAVQMLPPSYRETDSEILCVASYDALEEAPLAGGSTGIPCILASEEHEDPERILEAVQSWLLEDIRRNDHLAKLQKDISEGCGICEIVRHCSKIMGNPVLFVNHALNIVCQYPETGFGRDFSVSVADQVEQWRNTLGKEDRNRAHHCQIRHVLYKNEGYYIYVEKKASGIDDTRSKEYLQQICSMFGTATQKNGSDKKAQINDILTGFLQRRFEYPEKEKKRLELLGWKKHEKYTVLVVENKLVSESDIVCQELSKILNTDIYSQESYFSAVLNTEKYVEYTEQDFPVLRRYLEDKGMIGILSMGFFDIEYCAVRFEQAISCFDFVAKENKPGLRYYGRYQMSHFIKVLNKNNQIDLKSFCSPIILQIYEIDKRQKTDYLSTLFTYICSGQAMKYSADAMHIHVNTMYMRVSKLKDEFKIDFNDAHMLYTLHNSIVFLHQYDSSCLKASYPCLK